jgi:hypothetical protein
MTRTQAIAAYAARFHGALGSGHRAASPLGAWLLLALVAPAAEGERREEIEEALGLPSRIRRMNSSADVAPQSRPPRICG